MLYPLLHRLERAGYVSASWATAETGRKRKHYVLTEAGRAVLVERRSQWDVVGEALNEVWRSAQRPTLTEGGLASPAWTSDWRRRSAKSAATSSDDRPS